MPSTPVTALQRVPSRAGLSRRLRTSSPTHAIGFFPGFDAIIPIGRHPEASPVPPSRPNRKDMYNSPSTFFSAPALLISWVGVRFTKFTYANLGVTVTGSTLDSLPRETSMSVRNALVLLLTLSALFFLAACGGSNNVTQGVAPPTGGFSSSNLNGTYIFSASGTDVNGAPFAMVGTLTANGSGTISSGTIDINDVEVAPVPNTAVSSGSYTIGADGRGQINIGVPGNPVNGDGIVFDFVLQSGSHGLITAFNADYTGSGTIDLQSAGATPNGAYGFLFSGLDASNGSTANAFATVGSFTVGTGGAISGTEDFSDDGFAVVDETLSGTLVSGPSSTPGTVLTTTQYPAGQLYDVYVIDSTHLKFIEMDQSLTLSGDAYSQTSTTVPTGTLPFTISGSYPGAGSASAAGGFIVTDGAGNITTASTADANNNGSVTPTVPINFSGTYTGTGRFTLTLSGFTDGATYVAYPSSAGLLMLEIDNAGTMSGVAYPPQTTTTFSASQGYALNLTGFNFNSNSEEIDDIAEFAADSTGTTVTGVIDENYQPEQQGAIFGVALTGTYTAPDANGRGQISATAANGSNSTINGGLGLTFYTFDGSTFPFIETDANGQVSSGVFLEQSSSASGAIARANNVFVPHPVVKPQAFKKPLAK